MRERVLSYCRQHRLFNPGEKVLVAVSGGADSVALLSILCELREHLSIALFAVHVNHGFRGAESDADAAFVEALCEQWGVPCLARFLDIPALLKERGGSAQDVSRRERLRFYREVAELEGAATVALGHHKDDQAETVLLHLLRGSGAGGLSGMSPVTSLVGLRLVRPLLAERREALVSYLEERGISYRTDSSNDKDYYSRNLLRNRVMPLLHSISPQVVEAIARSADLLRDEDEQLHRLTEALWSDGVEADGDVVIISSEVLFASHVAMQRRLVRRAWLTMCGDSSDLDVIHVEYVLGLLTKQPGRMIELPRGILAVRNKRGIVMTKADLSETPYRLRLPVPGEVSLPGGMQLRARADSDASDAGEWCVQVSFLGSELSVRSRLPGDRYRPSGFSGQRKLQDVMSEAGVPLWLRGAWPVVLCGDTVVWTPGGRVAHGFEPAAGSRVTALSLHLGGRSDG